MKPERLKYRRAIVTTLALLVVLLASPALAADITWDGPTTNNWWSNPLNWDTDTVPVADDNAFLTNGTTATVDSTSPPLLNSLIVDGNFTATQTYYPSGNLSATAETIGLAGTGVYNQYAGSNTVGSVSGTQIANTTLDRTLVLGFRSGSSGTYNKSGGTLTAWDLIVGRAGTGEFNQSGNVTVDNDLTVGRNASGDGTYNISSGGLQVGGNETIGSTGVGNLSHSSGSHTIGGNLFVGRNAGSTGSFNMSSGTIEVGGSEYIGNNGIGTFNHTSGGLTIGGALIVGRNAGSTGTFTKSSGSIEVGGNEIIGAGGDGSLTHTSGSHTVGGNFILGRDAGTTGTFLMTSGSLDVVGLADIGRSGTGTITRISGSTTIGGKLTLAKNAASSGTFNVTSGSVTSNNSPPFDSTTDIQINPTGTFNINGTVTVTGDVVNDGTVKTTDADVTWNGDFVNNNAYISDPSTQRFQNDMNNTDTGYIQATHNQDLFLIRGDFINTSLLPSTKNEDWDTNHARLRFAKGGVGNDTDHEFRIAGKDNGLQGNVPITAIVDNYAWRLLNIKNQDIYLVDGTAGNSTVDGDGAQYVGALLGADVEFGMTNVVHNIFGDNSDVLNIYYDPDLSANSYLKLAGVPQIFDYQSGLGQLKPYHTPLPPSVLLLGTGLLGLGALGWRRKRNC